MKREGFTLIEMLVVIAIIALITAILIPSLRIMKLRGEAVVCKNNIRQMFLYMTMYEGDNGTLPNAFDQTREMNPDNDPGNASYDLPGWWWLNDIIDYSRKNFDEKSIILCPSKKINDLRFKYNILYGNYGVNLSICKKAIGSLSRAEFVGTPLSISRILHPNRSILVVDSGYSMINWWHVTDVPPMTLISMKIEDMAYVPGLSINEGKDIWPGLKPDAEDGRHPSKKVNVGFADGHVEPTKSDDLFVKKTEAGYDNRFPLWQPIKTNND